MWLHESLRPKIDRVTNRRCTLSKKNSRIISLLIPYKNASNISIQTFSHKCFLQPRIEFCLPNFTQNLSNLSVFDSQLLAHTVCFGILLFYMIFLCIWVEWMLKLSISGCNFICALLVTIFFYIHSFLWLQGLSLQPSQSRWTTKSSKPKFGIQPGKKG